MSWLPGSHGSVPSSAVAGGNTSSGEPLYIGRIAYDGAVTVGKIHVSHGSLYIPFAGNEVPFKEYEVLVEM